MSNNQLLGGVYVNINCQHFIESSNHSSREATFFLPFYSTTTVSTNKQLFMFSSMPGPSNSTVRSPSRIVFIGIAR
jgi:hypothetical protein